jgi:hypothetical protein
MGKSYYSNAKKKFVDRCLGNDKIARANKLVVENVNDWYKFSTQPQSEEDIRDRIIKEIIENNISKYLCLSYVCKYSKLSEDFIEELIYLTGTSRAKILNSIGEKIDTSNIKHSRVDWYNICAYQKLSEDFIERHKNDVLWSMIYRTQDLSEEFKQRHKHYYETSLGLNDSGLGSGICHKKSNV